MQKVSFQKSSKLKQDSQILIKGITGKSNVFYDVSELHFYFALANLNIIIENDSRLLKSHMLETFHLPQNQMNYFRTHGIHTNLIGYIHHKQYFIHHLLYNMINNIRYRINKCDLKDIKDQIKIIPFVQDIKGLYASKK